MKVNKKKFQKGVDKLNGMIYTKNTDSKGAVSESTLIIPLLFFLYPIWALWI